MDSDCLDDQTIAALLESALDDSARAAVHTHLRTCDACLDLVTALGFGLRDELHLGALPAAPNDIEAWAIGRVAPPAAPMWRIAVQRLQAGLTALAEGLQPLPAVALAVRGAGEDTAPLRYELDVFESPVQLLLVPVEGQRTVLRVELPAGLPGHTRVELEHGGALVASVALQAPGMRIAELQAGQYTLRFSRGMGAPIELPILIEAAPRG